MKGLYAFVRKNLKQNSHRTVVTIIGVTLTCILMFALGFGFTILLNKKNDEAIYYTGKYHFAYENIEASLLPMIQKNDTIDKIEVEYLVKEYKLSFYSVSLYARNQFKYSNIHLLSGRYPSQKGEIVLDTVISKLYQKNIGDIVEIEGETYTIVGCYETSSAYVEHNIYTYTKDINAPLVSVYMTLNSTKDAYLKIHNISQSLGFEVISYLDGLSYAHEKTNDALLMTHGQYRNYLQIAVTLLILMILLSTLSIVCILVIYNAFAISVMERKKALGVLSSIGATPGQLLKSVLYEATVIALIAIPLGFIITFGLGYLITWICNHAFFEILEVPLRFGIQPFYLLVCLLFILISIYLSALFPAMRAREVTPMEAIRMQQDIQIKRKKIKSGKWIRKLFGIEGEIAYKNRKRNKKRYRIVTLSLVIGIVLFVSFSAYLDLQKKMIQNNQDELSEDYNVIRVSLSGDQALKESYMKALLDGIEVTKLEKYRGIITKLDDSLLPSFTEEFQKKYPNFSHIQLVALQDEEYQQYLKQIHATEEKPIFRNTLYYKNVDTKEKTSTKVFESVDRLPLLLTSISGTVKTPLEIQDFYVTEEDLKQYEGNLFPSLYVPESIYEKWIGMSSDIAYQEEGLQTHYSIWTDDFKKIEHQYQNLKVPYAALYVEYNNMRYEDYQNILQLKVWNNMLFGIIAFIGVIAITSVLNTIHTSMNLRKKEFAMLRSIGMTPNQFYKMICLESIFFGIQSLIIGLLISSGIIVLLHKVMNIGKLPEEIIHYPFPVGYMIITIIFVFIIILIAMLYSTRKIKRSNIVDVLKEDDF